tara:strand:+ start:1047 stop:1532 length:486 start_codon:yes stop_codon:yes gene_type:complete
MFSDPQFWVFVSFLIFIAAIFNPIRKVLFTNLDNKIQEIKKSIDEAEKLKNQAQEILSEIEKRQNEVENEIENINQEAKNNILSYEKKFNEKLSDQINKKKNLASVKIDQITREANNAVKQYVAETTISSIIDILEKKLDGDEKEKILNGSIEELSLVLKN